jgi:predicted O-linked N-acetylglucosamine transferase (SPINDLY family)
MGKVTPGAARGRVADKLQEALACTRLGELAQASRIYEEILKVNPRQPDALLQLGVIAGRTNDPERALLLFGKVIALDPNNPAAFNNRGLALEGLGRWRVALENYDRALAIKADYAIAHYNRANALKALGRSNDAIASYRRAASLKPDLAETHFNLGVLLGELGQWGPALESYGRSVAVRPDYAEAYFNRASIFRGLTQWHAALESLDKAISARPHYPEAYLNRGEILQSLKLWEAALESYQRAAALKADYAKAYLNRGNVLRELRQFESALACYDRALEIDPNLDYLQGLRAYTKLQICDWVNFETELGELLDATARGKRASPPYAVLAMTDSAEIQRRTAEIWVEDRYPSNDSVPAIFQAVERERIRVGYFSADFHDHATAYLIAGLLESHDRSQFEVLGFSFGPESQGAMRVRIREACDEFTDVGSQSDPDVVQLARQRGLDIAVDLKGFTQDSRAGIFARRAAPLQVNFLGYPGTMGADYMDYIIADRMVVPEASRRHYSEKIVYMPDSYQVNDAKRAIAGRVFSKAELQLPAAGFVLCCFNNPFKVTPEVFDTWARILQRVDGSVLWLFEDNPVAVDHLRNEAAARKLDPARLVFAERMESALHLARHRAADLFLDAWPYNAHTTASDALWTGLPVLTCPGESFASRVAASLLSAVGLSELIAASPQEYEDLAVSLAYNADRLADLRRRLAEPIRTAPLFDTTLYTRHLESAFHTMHSRRCAGLMPEHIHVTRYSVGR